VGYWDDEKNVREYIKMSEGYEGKELIEILKTHLPAGSTVLELGMGEGKDLDILSEIFKETGTDISSLFVDLYKKKHEDADVFVLDARELDTNRIFDCIYSNKVLQHLTKSEFKTSLKKQKDLLNENGILFHSLWRGDKEEKYGDLLFVYYSKESLINLVENDYEIVEIKTYKETHDDDSLYIILKKK